MSIQPQIAGEVEVAKSLSTDEKLNKILNKVEAILSHWYEFRKQQELVSKELRRLDSNFTHGLDKQVNFMASQPPSPRSSKMVARSKKTNSEKVDSILTKVQKIIVYWESSMRQQEKLKKSSQLPVYSPLMSSDKMNNGKLDVILKKVRKVRDQGEEFGKQQTEFGSKLSSLKTQQNNIKTQCVATHKATQQMLNMLKIERRGRDEHDQTILSNQLERLADETSKLTKAFGNEQIDSLLSHFAEERRAKEEALQSLKEELNSVRSRSKWDQSTRFKGIIFLLFPFAWCFFSQYFNRKFYGSGWHLH